MRNSSRNQSFPTARPRDVAKHPWIRQGGFTLVALLCAAVLVAPIACDSASLLGGLGDKPAIEIAPADQEITDHDYAILHASTANVPEPSEDSDGIHLAAMLRWEIVSGGGTLERVDPESTALENAKIMKTDPANEYGAVVLYFPESGASGEVTIKCEIIRPTERTVINEFGEPVRESEDISIASSEAIIHVNDMMRLRLTPPTTTLPAAGTVSLKAIFEIEPSDIPDMDPGDADSPQAEPANIRYEWSMSGLAGAGELQSQSDSPDAVFTAFAEEATFTISVKTIETLEDGEEVVNGPAHAVVHVDPKLKVVHTFGYYLASDFSDDPDSYWVVAWLYFPKIQGAISYQIVAQGMHDDAFYGTGWTWNLTVAADGSITDIHDAGGSYRIGMSGASGSIASGGLGGAYAWMESRFSGMRAIVTAVVRE